MMSHNGARKIGNKPAEDSLPVKVRMPVDGKTYMYLHSYICSYWCCVQRYLFKCIYEYDYILHQMRVMDMYF